MHTHKIQKYFLSCEVVLARLTHKVRDGDILLEFSGFSLFCTFQNLFHKVRPWLHLVSTLKTEPSDMEDNWV